MARLACSAMRILLAGLLLSVLAVILSGCINLERFRHEKYSCTNNRAGVDEVIIRRAKKGAEVKIFSGGTEKAGQITSITDDTATISYAQVGLTVNRKSGAITVANKNRYYRLNCTVSVFTL